MTYHYCSSIRVLSSLHVYGFTATCFHVWLTLRMLSFVVDLVLVGSSNVSCAIVIYLSYCYGDQLSFAAFACLLRDSRHYNNEFKARCVGMDCKRRRRMLAKLRGGTAELGIEIGIV